MAKSLDRVLQSDGSYKWEMVEFQPELEVTTKVTEEPKKKASKKAKSPVATGRKVRIQKHISAQNRRTDRR